MSTVSPDRSGPQAALWDVAPNARHLTVAQVVRRALRMLILFVVARWLGVEGFGSYIVLLTVVEMIALISGYGYVDFLTREISQRPGSAQPLALKVTVLRLLYIL